MKIIQAIVIITIILLIILSIYMRMLSIKADFYHIDPLTDGVKGNQGGYYIAPQNADEVAPIFHMSKEELATKFDNLLSENGTLIAGDLHEGFATYLFRSRVFAFPDYMSIRIIEVNGNLSTIAIYSRLRIGQKDMGVNRTRVKNLISELINKNFSAKE